MYVVTLFCLALALLVLNSESVDYCSIKSCSIPSTQTLCRYKSSLPARVCGSEYINIMTQLEKDQILAYHNQQRALVASGAETRGNPGPQYAAASMPNMTWDNELELVAQRWANQCDYNHDQCRDVDRFRVGQNIGIVTTTGDLNDIDFLYIPKLWYNEIDKFSRNDINNYQFSHATGHYTQMVWANSVYLGCGVIRYKDSSGWNKLYMVCNYGPSGNWIGERVYEKK